MSATIKRFTCAISLLNVRCKQYALSYIIFLLLCSASPLSLAENTTTQETKLPWQTVFQLDNDLFSGSDRDYTNGIRVGFVKELGKDTSVNRFLQKQLYALSGAGDDSGFFKWRLRKRENLRFAYGFGLSQLMFTPDDSKALRAPSGQRPYAGWLGLEFSLHAKNNNEVSSITISVGTTGNASMAEEAQDWVHTNISNSPIYQGWDSQVPDQVTFNLHIDQKQRIDSLDYTLRGALRLDGYTEWGGAAGNFRTNLYVGGLVRFGYNLPATHSTPRVQLGSYGHELFRTAKLNENPFSIVLFSGIRATAVAHDITLDGPLFNSFDTGVKAKALTGEMIVGFGIRYLFADLSFSQTLRSDEFEGQNKNQRFGSVMLRVQSLF